MFSKRAQVALFKDFFLVSGVNDTCRFHVILSSLNKVEGYRIWSQTKRVWLHVKFTSAMIMNQLPSNFPTVFKSYTVAFSANVGVLIKIGCSVEITYLRMPLVLDFVKTRLSSLYFRVRIGKKWNGQVKTVQCSWSLIDIEYNTVDWIYRWHFCLSQ